MTAVIKIFELTASMAGTDKTASTVRFKLADNQTVDSNDPITIPSDNYIRKSYSKQLRLYCATAPDTQIDNLLINASITEEEKEQHERSIGALNYHSANQLIEYLKNNQLNPIESGLNYSQSDINKQLDLKLK